MSGLDERGRDMIHIYDITRYLNKEIILFTKQISDFSIKKLKYLDRTNPQVLVSCGKENICFWRMKNKFLTLHPVNLNSHAKNVIFEDFDIFKREITKKRKKKSKTGSENAHYLIYFVSSVGYLYIIDYNLSEMKMVYRIHNGPINSIKLSQNSNFIVSGGADGFIRIFSIDSADLLFEFKLESQIVSLDLNKEDLVTFFL